MIKLGVKEPENPPIVCLDQVGPGTLEPAIKQEKQSEDHSKENSQIEMAVQSDLLQVTTI